MTPDINLQMLIAALQGQNAPQPIGDFRGTVKEGTPQYDEWNRLPGGWTDATTVPKGMTPEQFMKGQPDNVEGVIMGDKIQGDPLMFMRQKAKPQEGIPMSQNGIISGLLTGNV